MCYNEVMKKKMLNTKQLMNKISSFYDDICSPCSRERIIFLSQFISDNKINSFIDASCSTGETIYNLANLNCYFTGIDFSKGMIKAAKAKNITNNAKFYCASMSEFVKKGAKYDCIYTNSINWLPSLNLFKQTLNDMLEALSDDGCLILDLPTNGNILYDENMSKSLTKGNTIYKKNTIIYKSKESYEYSSDTCIQTYEVINMNNGKIKKYIGSLNLLPLKENDINSVLIELGNKRYDKVTGYGVNHTDTYEQFIIYKK